MDPQFTRMLSRVLLVGGAIALIGTSALILAFRAFSPAGTRQREFRAVVLIAAVIAFVMLSCALLLRVSFPG